tara:strand:- start:7747 stop:8925 length:1179 start_codon:yes stop_codon:yes gene_type:complete
MPQQYLTKAKYIVLDIITKDEVNNIAIQKKIHNKYTIIKYLKEKCLPSDYYKVGFMRSMIVNNDTNQIVCVGPNKSIPVEEIQQYTEDASAIQFEEFVDGVMINVFWDEENNVWEYATRSNIGADIRFYLQNEPNLTFRKMFEEALDEDNINLDVLPKNYCYSFVLQHPRNRIVARVEKPHTVLVEAHSITDTVVTLYPHGKTKDDVALRNIIDNHSIPIPDKYDYKTMHAAREKHAARNTDFSCVGVIIKNYDTGWRSKIRNPVYEEVKKMRGNSPKRQFLYLTLRHSGNVGKYLRYYPEDSNDFQDYRKQVHNFTHNLYVNYVDCFINKKAHINTYPHQYRVCMTMLHKQYIDCLMPQGKHVHKGVVINFFNETPPQRQMYLLNYHFRKQ